MLQGLLLAAVLPVQAAAPKNFRPGGAPATGRPSVTGAVSQVPALSLGSAGTVVPAVADVVAPAGLPTPRVTPVVSVEAAPSAAVPGVSLPASLPRTAEKGKTPGERPSGERQVSVTRALKTHGVHAAKAAAAPGSESAAASTEANFLASAALGGTGGGSAVLAAGGRPLAARPLLGPARFAQADRTVPDDSVDAVSYAPGLDERLLPVVRALAEEVRSKPGELGHLLWALQELLKRGGVVRYSPQPANNDPLASYEPETNAIHVHLHLSRVNPRLQAALLAARLQFAYDHLVDRYPGIRETMVRPALAIRSFLAGTDLEALAGSLDINNEAELQLFRALRDDLLNSADGFDTLEWYYRDYPAAAETVASLEGQIEVEEADAAQVEQILEQNAGAVAKLKDGDPLKTELLQRRETLLVRASARRAELSLLRARRDALQRDLERETEGHYLGGPLWLEPGHAAAAVKETDLPVVRSQAVDPVDGRLEPVLGLMARTIAGARAPEARGRGYLVEALDRFRKLQGRIFFAPIQELAYVFPPLYQLVVDYTFVTLHPKLLVPILGHELAHVADLFGVPRRPDEDGAPRALSMETEFHAFEVWADLAKEYDPEEIAAEVLARPDLYDRETNLKMLQVIYEIVEHRHDRGALLALVERRYGQLLGITYQGLLPAEDFRRKIARQMGDELRELRTLELKEAEAQAYHEGRVDRGWLAGIERQKSLRRAMVLLYRRQIGQMERAMAEYQPGS